MNSLAISQNAKNIIEVLKSDIDTSDIIKDCGGGGDCFYLVLKELKKLDISVQEIRTIIANYLQENSSNYVSESDQKYQLFENQNTFDEYINLVRKNAYADNFTIAAAMEIFNISICIISRYSKIHPITKKSYVEYSHKIHSTKKIDEIIYIYYITSDFNGSNNVEFGTGHYQAILIPEIKSDTLALTFNKDSNFELLEYHPKIEDRIKEHHRVAKDQLKIVNENLTNEKRKWCINQQKGKDKFEIIISDYISLLPKFNKNEQDYRKIDYKQIVGNLEQLLFKFKELKSYKINDDIIRRQIDEYNDLKNFLEAHIV